MINDVVEDFEQCYRAVSSKDGRFDGWFVTAVTTTGIYCRPSCPAVTPKRGNVRFLPTAAAAQRAGFRACKRCRPDAAPGSPEWNQRADTVGRAMRLIADGSVDRDGVTGLARRLGFSERHLHRQLVAELGAGSARARPRAAGAHRAAADRDLGAAVHRGRLRRRLPLDPPVQRDRQRGLRHDPDRAAPPLRPPRRSGDRRADAAPPLPPAVRRRRPARLPRAEGGTGVELVDATDAAAPDAPAPAAPRRAPTAASSPSPTASASSR